jgi:hypothetical protein
MAGINHCMTLPEISPSSQAGSHLPLNLIPCELFLSGGRQNLRCRIFCIKERDWHLTQRIKENKDGTIVLSLITNHLFGVKRWVLSFGGGARVMQPKQLKDEIIRELKAGLRKHTTT